MRWDNRCSIADFNHIIRHLISCQKTEYIIMGKFRIDYCVGSVRGESYYRHLKGAVGRSKSTGTVENREPHTVRKPNERLRNNTMLILSNWGKNEIFIGHIQ